MSEPGQGRLLEAIRHLAKRKRIRPLLSIISRLPFAELKYLFAVIGLVKMPPGEWKFKDRVRLHKIAKLLPIEIHGAMMCRLWPRTFGERWPPKQALKTAVSSEAVDAMTARAEAERGLRHPRDEIELTDRRFLLAVRLKREGWNRREPGEVEDRTLYADNNKKSQRAKWRKKNRVGRFRDVGGEKLEWPMAANPEMLRITKMRVESAGADDPCEVARR